MNESFIKTKKYMDINDFYVIETPPSSSTSKDSVDDTLISFQTKIRLNLSTIHNQQKNLTKNSMNIKDQQLDSSVYDDMHTPLRRTLGNTKLKTRQDVRRFRKFLKRNYDISSMTLIDIDPDRMRTYLIDYLTSIRTRKGLKYDPETLRSYYLSIQRFLKDSNYPYCLRNSPQFAQCRDLIIQMRKEKNQSKSNDLSLTEPIDMKKSRLTIKKSLPIEQTLMNYNLENQPIRHNHQASSSEPMSIVLTKDLLPSSSLPPRKRQQMKYFLEFGSPHDFLLLPKPSSSSSTTPTIQSPASILSSDAYLLLVKFTHSSSLSKTSSHPYTHYIEQLLDDSPACGNIQRLMLTTLCHQWTGDIRLIHANLRPELNSFLPHILVLNILSSKYSY